MSTLITLRPNVDISFCTSPSRDVRAGSLIARRVLTAFFVGRRRRGSIFLSDHVLSIDLDAAPKEPSDMQRHARIAHKSRTGINHQTPFPEENVPGPCVCWSASAASPQRRKHSKNSTKREPDVIHVIKSLALFARARPLLSFRFRQPPQPFPLALPLSLCHRERNI